MNWPKTKLLVLHKVLQHLDLQHDWAFRAFFAVQCKVKCRLLCHASAHDIFVVDAMALF